MVAILSTVPNYPHPLPSPRLPSPRLPSPRLPSPPLPSPRLPSPHPAPLHSPPLPSPPLTCMMPLSRLLTSVGSVVLSQRSDTNMIASRQPASPSSSEGMHSGLDASLINVCRDFSVSSRGRSESTGGQSNRENQSPSFFPKQTGNLQHIGDSSKKYCYYNWL